MPSGPLLLCLDIGSSACKGALIDSTGKVIGTHRESYPLLYAAGGREVEQEPEVLWAAAQRCLAELSAEKSRASRIAGISLSAQMSTHMLVAADGGPLTRFISWADRRAEKESREMAATFSAKALALELGATLQVAPSWPLPRLKWWRTHQPAVLDAARYLVQPKDWILWKLCGVWLSDLSSLRGWVHQESGRVSPLLAKWAGFEPILTPPTAEPAAVAGLVQRKLAQDLGLPNDVPVFVGWNDLAAAVLGCTGLPDRAVGFDITGTSEHLGICYPTSEAPKSVPVLSEIPLGPDHGLRYGVTSSSGRILQWYREQFRGRPGGADGYGEMEREAAAIASGSEGLIFLPCLDGERAPWFNPGTRGGFHNLGLSHSQAHFSRAVLEGIAFTLRSILQRLGLEKAPDEFHVLGGGSAMAAWNQIKADVLQTPVVTMECAEAGCLGAAILAARGLGWHSSWESAGAAYIRSARTFEPNRNAAGLYEKQHVRFEKIYRAMEPLFAEASGSETN